MAGGIGAINGYGVWIQLDGARNVAWGGESTTSDAGRAASLPAATTCPTAAVLPCDYVSARVIQPWADDGILTICDEAWSVTFVSTFGNV